MTAAYAQNAPAPSPPPDFQATGSHINDPANKRDADEQRNADFQAQGSHVNDPNNARNADDKANKRDVK